MTPLTALLGRRLKDDVVLAAMRERGIGEVIYDLGRLQKGSADRYEYRGSALALVTPSLPPA